MCTLRTAVIKLAQDNPDLREHLVPVLRRTAAPAISDKQFDALRPGSRFWAKVKGPWSAGEIEFQVGRSSYSKKYDVHSKTLLPIGEDGKPEKTRTKWILFKRDTGVTMAHGNMGVVIQSARF